MVRPTVTIGCDGGGGTLGGGERGQDQQNIISTINFSQRYTTVLSMRNIFFKTSNFKYIILLHFKKFWLDNKSYAQPVQKILGIFIEMFLI